MLPLVVYRGPSRLGDGQIVAVLTGLEGDRSKNRKTGPMAQLWILAESGRGTLSCVCGSCPISGRCYAKRLRPLAGILRRSHGVQPNLWRALAGLRRTGLGLRLGAFGDPAALPPEVLRCLVSAARYHTGYTHDWAHPRSAHLRGVVQASVECADDAAMAHLFGWSTFRVGDEGPKSWELHCPGQRGKGTCSECKACSGSLRNVYTNWH